MSLVFIDFVEAFMTIDDNFWLCHYIAFALCFFSPEIPHAPARHCQLLCTWFPVWLYMRLSCKPLNRWTTCLFQSFTIIWPPSPVFCILIVSLYFKFHLCHSCFLHASMESINWKKSWVLEHLITYRLLCNKLLTTLVGTVFHAFDLTENHCVVVVKLSNAAGCLLL